MGGNQFPLFQNKLVLPAWLETGKHVDINHVYMPLYTDCTPSLRQTHMYILLIPLKKKKKKKIEVKKENKLVPKKPFMLYFE